MFLMERLFSMLAQWRRRGNRNSHTRKNGIGLRFLARDVDGFLPTSKHLPVHGGAEEAGDSNEGEGTANLAT
jgi:hypothetical protein